jgi:GT2 family glycosyltransferase
MSLVLGVGTFHWEGWARCVRSWNEKAMWWRPMKIVEGLRVVDAYQRIYELTKQQVILYIHDDLICLEPDWDVRVMKEFTDPKVGVVGFAGAWGHGDPDLYKKPYELPQLARRGFMSNLKDAEKHGARFTGSRDVVVLDGIALAVRRELMTKMDGWPITGVDYFMYSEYLCCMARRLGYKIRLVGIEVEHLGGRSTGLNRHTKFDFEGEHKFLYEHFSDVLPAEVQL